MKIEEKSEQMLESLKDAIVNAYKINDEEGVMAALKSAYWVGRADESAKAMGKVKEIFKKEV